MVGELRRVRALGREADCGRACCARRCRLRRAAGCMHCRGMARERDVRAGCRREPQGEHPHRGGGGGGGGWQCVNRARVQPVAWPRSCSANGGNRPSVYVIVLALRCNKPPGPRGTRNPRPEFPGGERVKRTAWIGPRYRICTQTKDRAYLAYLNPPLRQGVLKSWKRAEKEGRRASAKN